MPALTTVTIPYLPACSLKSESSGVVTKEEKTDETDSAYSSSCIFIKQEMEDETESTYSSSCIFIKQEIEDETESTSDTSFIYISRRELYDIIKSLDKNSLEEKFEHVKHVISERTNCPEYKLHDLYHTLSFFFSKFKKKWNNVYRLENRFLKKHSLWLDGFEKLKNYADLPEVKKVGQLVEACSVDHSSCVFIKQENTDKDETVSTLPMMDFNYEEGQHSYHDELIHVKQEGEIFVSDVESYNGTNESEPGPQDSGQSCSSVPEKSDKLERRATCRFCPYQKKRKTAYKCFHCEKPLCLEHSIKVCNDCV